MLYLFGCGTRGFRLKLDELNALLDNPFIGISLIFLGIVAFLIGKFPKPPDALSLF